MKTVVYQEKRTFQKYDNARFALYLNEAEADYVPTGGMEREGEEAPVPVPGFSYTGTEEDGSTLVVAKSANYGDFVAGLIRTRYSADEVEAINSNMIVAIQTPKHARAAAFKAEQAAYQAFREECKNVVKVLFPA